AHVPVEVAFADFEGAFQRRGEAVGVGGRAGGARDLPQATPPVGDGLAGRVEVAVGVDAHAEGRALERIARDLALGGAGAVAEVGAEADVVRQVIASVDEQQLVVARRAQVHLLVRVALVQGAARRAARGRGGAGAGADVLVLGDVAAGQGRVAHAVPDHAHARVRVG